MNTLKEREHAITDEGLKHSSLFSEVDYQYKSLMSKASELSFIPFEELETTRKYPFCFWKYSVWYILRKKGITFETIAQVAKRNHSTVINGVRRVEDCITYGTGDAAKSIYTRLETASRDTAPNYTISTTRSAIVEWLNTVTMDKESMNKLLTTISSLSIV